MAVTGFAEQTQAAIYIERVTIRNFKGIKRLTVDLRPGLTLLVGRNNAGKSRILRAIQVAVGGAQVERDDLTVGSIDAAEIDVVVAPRLGQQVSTASSGDDSGDTEPDEESFVDVVQQIFGTALSMVSTSPVRQRLAWRTTVTTTAEGSGARGQSHVMAYDESKDDWQTTGTSFGRDLRSFLYAELVDTRRDLDEELRRRGTAIRRILNNLRVPDTDRAALEEQLAVLGNDITQTSETLTVLTESLNSLDRYLDSLGEARVDPVPRTLEELARTVGVSFDDGSGSLASRLHGSGVRSLASLLVQDVFYGQSLGIDGRAIRPSPVTLIEEPEAHLHPHAIFEVPALLEQDGRQVVATTHSPQLAASVSPESLLLVRQSQASGHSIVGFGPAEDDDRRTRKPGFYANEMEKLTRLAERPFGDLLFASAIVIGDGATERAFLPLVLRAALGPLAHGISVIDSGGMDGQVVPSVIKLARHVEVPLVIFADADEAGRERVNQLVSQGLLDKNRDIVWARYPGAEQMNRRKKSSVAVERMMIDFDSSVCRRACAFLGDEPKVDNDILAVMKRHKGSIGGVLAQEFVKVYPSPKETGWPEPLVELTSRLRKRINNEPIDGGAPS